jgi:hypothetical protein
MSRSVSRGGWFSGVDQWPVLGVHRGSDHVEHGMLVPKASNEVIGASAPWAAINAVNRRIAMVPIRHNKHDAA